MVDKDKVIDFFVFTNLPIKGLTKVELRRLSLLSARQVELLIEMFSPLMTCFDNFYKLLNKNAKEFCSAMVYDVQETNFYKKIGDTLEDSINSVRKLEEQTYAYMRAKEYF